MDKNTEYIICSAIWYNDGVERVHLPKNIKTGIVVAGHRHANCITQLKVMFYDNYREDKFHDEIRVEVNKHSVQGFLTSKGMFVDRTDAGKIAFQAGQCQQIKNRGLFSEDIY